MKIRSVSNNQANLSQRLKLAWQLHQEGKLDQAALHYAAVLKAQPKHFDALHLLGMLRLQQARHAEGLDKIQAALKLQPANAEALSHLGFGFEKLGKLEEALASYDEALAIKPGHLEALYNRGNLYLVLKRPEEALASYDKVLAIRPDHAETLNNRGNTLRALKRPEEALASYDKALAIRPGHGETFYNRGAALQDLMRFQDALASYDRAISIRPGHAETFNNRGNTLGDLRRLDEALASYDKALAIKPDYVEALNNRGNVLRDLKRLDEALASYDKALAIKPDYIEALNNRGNVLREMNRFEEALASYDRALIAQPDHAHALSGAADCAIKLCDWHGRTRFAVGLYEHVPGKKSVISPFTLLGYSGDSALLLQSAKHYIENKVPLLPPPLWTGEIWRHDRVRIAYLSADFRRHPMSYVIAELFERHDRSRFETIGVSIGIDDHSDVRKRIVAAFDQFHDVYENADEEIAKLLNDLEVDIAIDLMGYTQSSRPRILAYRPAPIQVNYLGFPGTMGTELIDYIIADKVVAPFEHQQFYIEKIVHLSDTYYPHDSTRQISPQTPSRAEMGLPENAFVFCCFNNCWKINPEVFDVWMHLLHEVNGSVLWLLRDSESVERNLRWQAQQRGVYPARLVFAPRLPLDEHLPRHRLAGLFLDTLPYNAHTTASDALRLGLPVLTCKGQAFAGRVAASLLHAIGLPELITYNLAEYQALALNLARNPVLLSEIKTKLTRNRETYPLFKTDRFTRHIEAAFMTMWQRWQRGELPKSFSVEPT
jgi:protein O-GlcNAc transferase